jgi:hypothetical protein
VRHEVQELSGVEDLPGWVPPKCCNNDRDEWIQPLAMVAHTLLRTRDAHRCRCAQCQGRRRDRRAAELLMGEALDCRSCRIPTSPGVREVLALEVAGEREGLWPPPEPEPWRDDADRWDWEE